MVKRYLKKKKYFLIIFFIFLFNLTSIIFFQNRINNSINKYENSDSSFDDITSLPHTSNGPLNKNYFKYYKEITIDHTKVSGSSDLINFPVLISLFDSDLHNKTQSDGDDIAFSNGTIWLDHEIELFDKDYNITHAQLVAWVRIPSLSPSTDTIIKMYYGNSTMGSQENPAFVWDNNYKGVWHLKENPAENALAAVKASGVSATASVDITTMFNGSMVVGGLGHQGGDTAPHDPGGDITTERFDIASGTSTSDDSGYAGGEINTTTAGTYTFQWTGQVSDDWSIAAIELRRAEPAVPITFDNVTTDSSSSARNTASFSHTIGEGDNPVIVVIVMSSGDHDQMKVTYGGVPLFRAVDMRGGTSSSQEWITIWYETNPPPGANDVVVYWKTDKVKDPSAVAALSYFGVAPRPLTMKDSTSNSNHGTPHGNMTSSNQITGISGGALDFDGVDDNVIVVGFSNDIVNSPLTMSGWIVGPDSPPTAYAPFGIRYSLGATRPNEFYVFQHGDGNTIECTFKNSVGDGFRASPDPELNPGVWNYVAMVYDGSYIRVYIDGIEEGSASANGYFDDTTRAFKIGMVEAKPWIGSIDEVRFSDIARSADWIATEYNNQYDPNSFFTISSEEIHDYTPPTYSDLIESSDPLELGDTEVISINVTDPSGIKQVKIEFEASNYSMTNISGDTWRYNSWTPTNIGNYSYAIYMEDNKGNWNSTSGSIQVIDTTPPTYSNLIESADPLKFGQNETISIKVFDSPGTGVNQTIIEYELSNHTMIYAGGNTWTWSKWKPSEEIVYSYKIYMQDKANNWNMTSGNITVRTTTAPVIENLNEWTDPLELGDYITIHVDVHDNETYVDTVLIELQSINYTMVNISGNTYEYTWTRSLVGTVGYTIYANDTGNNWNSLSSSFDIIDTTPPTFSDLNESGDPLEFGNTEVISINCTDLAGIKKVQIEFGGLNYSMPNIGGDTWQYTLWTPSSTGIHLYTIWIEDNNNNWNYTMGSILVQDTTPPAYSNLTQSPPDPVELESPLVITIIINDISEIDQVLIEFEGNNHSMVYFGGDLWRYDSWMPNRIGNYLYTIFMKDNHNNWNSTSGSITFQDTISPAYSDLTQNPPDPVELGSTVVIRINVNDFAGINQTLIEFEGLNHSMVNIFGNTWQYDSWTPNNRIVYQYRIFMEDKSGNWNFTNGNITVQDTTPPSPPIITSAPSGDVKGVLAFDWLDGSDPSGILYYILIIDNETDPDATPGYVYIFNITNTGPQSSYCVLPQNISLGDYFYFLAQIDGVGQQSIYTMGTFTVISVGNGSPENNTLIIIVIILASVIGSLTAIVIVRKKLKKEITPAREKIPFKIITSHINKLSSSQLAFQAKKIQRFPLEGKQEQFLTERELTNEQELEVRIKEIKYLGEDLFVQGAYLEAQEQFKFGRDLLLNVGREEEAQLFSELISGIEGLIEEREKRLEVLEQIKNEGNSVQIFESYSDIIEISKKLKDSESKSFYQSELVNYFQNNQMNLIDLVEYRSELNQKAESLLNNNLFDLAAQLYKKCEKVSQLLAKLDLEEEIDKIEEFKNKKNECLKKINK